MTKQRTVGQKFGGASLSDADSSLRGRGLIQGIRFPRPGQASAVSRAAFERGLVIETAGPEDDVLELLPPLVLDPAGLETGLDRIAESVAATATAATTATARSDA